jgi:hypothetical protein
MFSLPQADDATIEQWQGVKLKGLENLTDFTIVWCGVPSTLRLHRNNVKAEHVFVLKKKDQFKYAYHDTAGFNELPEKWYTRCFTKVDHIPSDNQITVCVKNTYIDLPYLPISLFNRKMSSKKRKKTHRVCMSNVYPSWKHQQGEGVHFEIAKEFKEIFDRADAGEIILQDPFEGYDSMEAVQRSKTGKTALRTVAGFVYYHCRDHLGYPVTI